MTSERLTRTLSYLLILAAALLVAACNGNLPPPDYTASLTSSVNKDATGTGGANLTTGNELGVFGTYSNLSSDETSAWVTGSGPNLPFQLQQEDKGTNGEFIGQLILSEDEVAALKQGELGIAIYTENYPISNGIPELAGKLTPNQ